MTPPMVTPAPVSVSTARTRENTPPPPVRAREATPTPPPAIVQAPAFQSSPAFAPPPPVVSASVDQTMAAISAKGPEYEAIAKLSREIIERIVWEVVPELADAIIRERLEKQRLA
jgi:hypothetical protein